LEDFIINNIKLFYKLFNLIYRKGVKVPYINIYLLDGRTEEQKREMASRITDVVSEVGKVQREMVHILFIDMPRTNISKGGILVSDKK